MKKRAGCLVFLFPIALAVKLFVLCARITMILAYLITIGWADPNRGVVIARMWTGKRVRTFVSIRKDVRAKPPSSSGGGHFRR